MSPRVEHIGDATLYLGDCREILPTIGKVDAVVTDPPYGITDHKWDVVLDPSEWMVCGAVSFAAEPFATDLINRAPILFRYDLVWNKNTATNLENCHLRPARTHERILVFGHLPYYPQKRRRSLSELSRLNETQRRTMDYANPGSVLTYDAVNNRNSDRTGHPSQKPIALLEYLILSYTDCASMVCDPFMGSGTTGVACVRLGRRFIGIEIEPRYFDIACRRIDEAQRQGRLFDAPKPKAEQLTLDGAA